MRALTATRISQARFTGLILLLIITLGAVLRIVNLGSDSIWLDEAYSIQFAHLPVPQLLAETAASDVHPPLYYLLLHFWINLFGDSETAARLLSALFSLLAIPVIYLVASLLFDRATALLSALLLAVSLYQIEFAQEARMYSLLALLSLLSLYFFLKLWAEARALHFVGYVISTSLLMHTHVYGFFIIIAENLFVLSLWLTRPEQFKRLLVRWLLLQAALVVLFLPWLSIMLQQYRRVRQGFWIPPATLDFLRQTWIIYAGSRWLSLLFLPLVALGIFSSPHARHDDHSEEPRRQLFSSGRRLPFSGFEKTCFLLFWFLSPILIPFVLSQFLTSIYLPKYTIAASAAFLILAARGIMSIRADWARVLLLTVLLGLSLVNLRAYWSGPHKDFWRESAGYFDRTARGGDLVIFHQGNGQVPFRYYSKRDDIDGQQFLDDQVSLTMESVGTALQKVVAGRKRVWLISSHPTEMTALITKQLGESYQLTEHRIDPGVELYLFEREARPVESPAPDEH